MHRASPCFAVLLFLSLLARLSAFVPQASEVWRDGPIQLAAEFGSAPAGTTNWQNALNDAMAAWNAELATARLTVVPASGSPDYDNGRNEIFFSRDYYGQPFPAGVPALTRVTTDRGVRLEADIVLNANLTWSIYGGPSQAGVVDFRRVVLRELGYFLGLGPPDLAGQRISALLNERNVDLEDLTADDREGARTLYGAEPNGRPIFVLPLGGWTAVEGGTLALKAAVGGRGPLTYQWFHDGTPIAGATSPRLEFVARRADAGDYLLVVQNDRGSTTSTTARVTVAPATAPVVSLTTPAVTATAGADVVLSALVRAGTEPIRFEWHRNGVIVATTERPVLTLSDVQFDDAGDYSVTATNMPAPELPAQRA